MSALLAKIDNLLKFIDSTIDNVSLSASSSSPTLKRANKDVLSSISDIPRNISKITGKMYNKKRSQTLKNSDLCLKIVASSIDWALSNGLTMGSQSISNAYIHAPYTLLPVLINLNEYSQLQSISIIFHKLIDSISHDHDFLIQSISTAAKSDKLFTEKMLNLYLKQIKLNEFNQKYQLGIFRSDYMKNSINNKWSQIEFNTISASFGVLSDKVHQLHQYILNRYLNINCNTIATNTNTNTNDIYYPSSNTTYEIAYGLATAAKLVHASNPMVLMLVQENEKNISDQRCIEWELWNTFKVKLIRRTMLDVYKYGRLDPNTKELIIDNKCNISCVYFRSGYTPRDYGKEGYEWKAREIIEFSTAIKCPSIAYHLLGSKLFQTIFCKKDVLLKYLNEYESNQLLSCFVKLYSLENNQNDKNIINILKDVQINYQNYVLKPQREGGNNNYYGNNIPKLLNQLNENELKQYILMERIYPHEIDTIQIRNCKSFNIRAISEMGIYSCYLHDGSNNKPIINKISGTLLRTKQAQVTEGGVATGYAVLDSVLLSNDNV